MKIIERYEYHIEERLSIEHLVDGLVGGDDKEVWYVDCGIELKIHDTENE